MSKKTIVDFGANMGGQRQNSFFGSLLGGTFGLPWGDAAQRQAFDPAGYLIGADPAVPGSDATVTNVRPICYLCGQPGHDGICFRQQATQESDAARMWSGIQNLRARQSIITPPPPAVIKPSVETIEHKPRVIELESEDEP